MWKNLNLICFGEKKAWLIPDEIIQTGIYKIPTLLSNAPVVFVVHTSWGFPKSLTILQKQQGSCCVHCFFLDSSLDKLNWNISRFSFPLVYTLGFHLFCTFKLPTGILVTAVLWQLKHSPISWHRKKLALPGSLSKPKDAAYWTSSCSRISNKHPWGWALPRILAHWSIWKRIC